MRNVRRPPDVPTVANSFSSVILRRHATSIRPKSESHITTLPTNMKTKRPRVPVVRRAHVTQSLQKMPRTTILSPLLPQPASNSTIDRRQSGTRVWVCPSWVEARYPHTHKFLCTQAAVVPISSAASLTHHTVANMSRVPAIATTTPAGPPIIAAMYFSPRIMARSGST